jgi:TolB-like protein
VRVAVVYGVASWLILQLADVFGSLLALPAWTGKLVILLLALGLPVALVMSWVYEITPEGLARTSDVDGNRSIAPQTGRRLDRMIMVGLVLAIGILLVDRYLPRDQAAPSPTRPADQEAAVASQPRSIAVLPFVNMSNDPGNEYFSDGMSEEILNTLAGVDGLQVAARTSSFRFKGQAADVAEIGRQLKVGAILEGSVRRQGDSVRITAQLIDVTNGYHLWSRTFDRSLENAFAVQTEIASQIVEALQLELRGTGSGGQAVELRELPTQNARAYELFLQGRHLWRQRNGPAVTRATELLTEAVTLDPEFAEAHAALASAWFVLQSFTSIDATTSQNRAIAAAKRARALAPSLAEPLAVEGSIAGNLGRWSEAERLFRRAIELEPQQATPHHWLSLHYLHTGYLAGFSSEAQVAYTLDPANAAIVSLLGVPMLLAGDFVGAQRQFEKAASLGAVFAGVVSLPQALYDGGHPDQALAAARRGYERIGLGARHAELIHAAILDPTRRSAARDEIMSAPRDFYSASMRIYDLMRIGEFELAVSEALTAPDAVPRDLLFCVWHKTGAPLRRTQAFKRFAREAGLVAYWQERGWPDKCRPRGDDFDCE